MLKYVYLLLLVVIVYGNIEKLNADIAPIVMKSDSYIIVDTKSNVILQSKNPDKKIVPSSMSKLMTIYIIFDFIKNNKIKLSDKVNVSENAFKKGHYSTGGSSMFLNKTDNPTVEELIKGVIVASGNDASIAIAEYISGTEEDFVNLMNSYAEKIGMKNSHFNNTNGWPDKIHYSTVKDLTILGKRLNEDFPEYYYFFKEKDMTFNKIKQTNRNRLLFDDKLNVDGLKTGHTVEGGYSVAFSSANENLRLIGVVSGLQKESQRIEESKKLIRWAYNNFTTKLLFKRGDVIKTIPVFNGNINNLDIIAEEDIYIIFPSKSQIFDPKNINIKIKYLDSLNAPVSYNKVVATIVVENKNNPEYNQSFDFKAGINIEEDNLFYSTLKLPYQLIRKITK
jgi:D-alanyl-D-alanine carboxypeptidase (penicillin-binding protein 5/6)